MPFGLFGLAAALGNSQSCDNIREMCDTAEQSASNGRAALVILGVGVAVSVVLLAIEERRAHLATGSTWFRPAPRLRAEPNAEEKRTAPRLPWWAPLLIPLVSGLLIAVADARQGDHVVQSSWAGAIAGQIGIASIYSIPAYFAGRRFEQRRRRSRTTHAT